MNILVLIIFMFVIIGVFVMFIVPIIVFASTSVVDYNFVYCTHEPTNSTITYPEDTVCEFVDDDDKEEDEEKADEKEHEREAKAWDR
jgi:hypothetical protein